MHPDEDAAAIAAIVRSREAGFQFMHIQCDGELVAIYAERHRAGAVDLYVARSPAEAHAARFRAEDHGNQDTDPLWHTCGPVAEVITALLALPPHGAPGSPKLARGTPSDLWLPDRSALLRTPGGT